MAISITESDLLEPLRNLIGPGDFAVESYTSKVLYQSSVNGFNGGNYLVEATVRRKEGLQSCSMVLKILRRSDALGSQSDTSISTMSDVHYPDREMLVFTSGLLINMPDGLTGPRFYGLDRKEDGDWLWMEYIETDPMYKWTADDYAAAAKAIGRWNVAISETKLKPDFP